MKLYFLYSRTQTRKTHLADLFLNILVLPLLLGTPNEQQYCFPIHSGSKPQRCLSNLLLYPPSNHLPSSTDSLTMYHRFWSWQRFKRSYQVSPPVVQRRKLRLRELGDSTMKLYGKIRIHISDSSIFAAILFIYAVACVSAS